MTQIVCRHCQSALETVMAGEILVGWYCQGCDELLWEAQVMVVYDDESEAGDE